ncbi:MAG: hypothetical protein KDE59_15095, partial [Anaerolineales bacterium]|nr:hypothetical protein [Anaerolineales bacterium]
VIGVAEAMVPLHQAYAPELMEELQGTADATGVSIPELIIVNGFTDFVDTVYTVARRQPEPVVDMDPHDDCTAFLIPDAVTAEGAGFFGQTWDMHDSATPYVMLLRVSPNDGPSSLLFTITGCVGMIGMNSAGIAVGINNLLGGDGQIGVTWTFVVRKALQQTNLEDALACIMDADLAGAHNYQIYDKHNRGYNIEAMSTHKHVTPLDGQVIAHTNHCLLAETIALCRPRHPDSQLNSESRLAAAYRLTEKGKVTLDDLIALTGHEDVVAVPSEPFHVETCGAAIMQPRTGRFWAAWGNPAATEYEEFTV